MFRSFTATATAPATDDLPGFLLAVLGGDDPGRVTWAPKVFEMARDYGLVLLESGRLVDVAAGEAVPEGACLMPPTRPEQAAALREPTTQEAERFVVRTGADAGRETAIIGEHAPIA